MGGNGAGGRPERGSGFAARARRQRGRETLAKLRAAAIAELTGHGYHGARVARITKRAGTSHGAFYVYFEDLDDMLLALQHEVITDADALMARLPPLRPGTDGIASLRAWLDDGCALLLEQAPVRDAVLAAMLGDADARLTRRALRAQRTWTATLAGRIRAAEAPGIDADLAALSLVNVMDQACLAAARSQLVVSRDELVDGLTELFHRSVFGTAPIFP